MYIWTVTKWERSKPLNKALFTTWILQGRILLTFLVIKIHDTVHAKKGCVYKKKNYRDKLKFCEIQPNENFLIA